MALEVLNKNLRGKETEMAKIHFMTLDEKEKAEKKIGREVFADCLTRVRVGKLVDEATAYDHEGLDRLMSLPDLCENCYIVQSVYRILPPPKLMAFEINL